MRSHRRTRIPALATLVAIASISSACNDVPVSSLEFSVKVTESKDNTEPVKVDFLWVIDNSASMCQEQASLAASFEQFLTTIASFVNIDYRIAVVTTDVISADHSGIFRHHRANEFPFACSETTIVHCLRGSQGDEVCEQFGDNWICDAPEKPKNITNCNGTLNSKCRKLCTQDADCDAQFISTAAGQACVDDPSTCQYKCLIPSGDPSNSGCVLRPTTDGCPGDAELYEILVKGDDPNKDPNIGHCVDGQLCYVDQGCGQIGPCYKEPPFLTPETAAQYFNCVGVVGAEQHNNANLEQGLNAALFALDKGGPNAVQAQRFIRDDAYLVIVFVSDEDDCSVDDGQTLKKEQYGTCTCLNDTNNGGKLRPVKEAVNRIKALKGDPGRVLVAAIVGDAVALQSDGTPKTEEQITEERDLYFSSKCSSCPNPSDQHPLLFNTYVCTSKAGKADYGSRYVEFVQGFGKNGILTNICSDEGVGPALDTIADRIIRVLTRICLPKPLVATASELPLSQQAAESGLVVKKVGPEGTCTDGAACCVKNSTACNDPIECADGAACVPTEKILEYGEVQGEETYQIQVASDCELTPQRHAVFFNFLLAPGSGVIIDYQAEKTQTPTTSP